MTEYLALVFVAGLIAAIIWAVVLYILSPFLMGDAAPRRPRAIRDALFARHKSSNIASFLRAESQLIASAVIVRPPVTIDLAAFGSMRLDTSVTSAAQLAAIHYVLSPGTTNLTVTMGAPKVFATGADATIYLEKAA